MTGRHTNPPPFRGTFGPIHQWIYTGSSTRDGHADVRDAIAEIAAALPYPPDGS